MRLTVASWPPWRPPSRGHGLHVTNCGRRAGYCAGLRPVDVRAAFTAIAPLRRDVENFRFAGGTVNLAAHQRGDVRIVSGQGSIDGVAIAVPWSGGVLIDGSRHDVVCRGPAR